MAGAHIFREKRLSGWLGRVFLEEKGSSGWLGRVFLEKKACLDGWPDLSEIQEISPEFSFMVFD